MEEILNKINLLYEKGIIENKVQKLTMNYFRMFEEGTVINFNYPLVVLVGKNGTGKSTVLKLLKTLSKKQNPSKYFFESSIDQSDQGKEYIWSSQIEGKTYINFKKKKQWLIIDDINELSKLTSFQEIDSYFKKKYIVKPEIQIESIEFKTLIGAFDKSLFFDNISRSQNMDKKISYSIKQSRKILQNKNDKSRNKQAIHLTEDELKDISYILDKEYEEITICKHRYFSGTWGTTVLFKSDKEYSEFNSGSGEFIIAVVVNKIKSIRNNTILLLDEPEISIHPGAQKRFMKYLLKVILNKKLQVIISTHSPSIIEKLPSKCIISFRENNNNKIEVYGNKHYLEGFYDLEFSFNKKNIIVEDNLAKNILIAICKEEGYLNLFDINYFPGGAESIKTLLITAFSKTDETDRFIIFDGDKYVREVIDLNSILEKDKDILFYTKEFKEITGVNSKNIKWGIDGNKCNVNKQKNLDLCKLIDKYLNFYKENVFFFPENIPEQIIFDINYLERVFESVDLLEIQQIDNCKEKFLKLSELTGIQIEHLESLFISHFVKGKKASSNYQQIKSILDRILAQKS